jgi:hypothetical protein
MIKLLMMFATVAALCANLEALGAIDQFGT